MTTPGNDPHDDEGAGPLGSAVSEPDGADGMAGPVYPPPETEPDAQGSTSD